MSFYRDQLEQWLNEIDVKADKILDIGGSAYPVKGRVKSWEVETYHILDNNNEENYHDKFTPPDHQMNIEIRNEDIDREIKTMGKFDVIFCLEVFEYLSNPSNAIQNIYKLLRTDGILYISFPAIYPVHNPVESDKLRYTKEWIKWAFAEEWIIEITPRVATAGREHLEAFYRAEGMRSAKVPEIFDIGYMVKATKI